MPTIIEVIKNRDVDVETPLAKVRIGGRDVPVTDVTEQFLKRLDDLEKRVSELSIEGEGLVELSSTPGFKPSGEALPRRVLWVDDEPDGIALEMASLEERNIDVSNALTTAEALDVLENDQSFDAVITDVGRTEEEVRRKRAGLVLTERVRALYPTLPVLIYTSPRRAPELKQEGLLCGAYGVTASPSELFEMLAVNIGPRTGERLANEVTSLLESRGFAVEPQANRGVDMIASTKEIRIAIEVRTRIPDDLPHVLQRISEYAAESNADETWLVVPQASLETEPLGTGHFFPHVSLVTISDMRQGHLPFSDSTIA